MNPNKRLDYVRFSNLALKRLWGIEISNVNKVQVEPGPVEITWETGEDEKGDLNPGV